MEIISIAVLTVCALVCIGIVLTIHRDAVKSEIQKDCDSTEDVSCEKCKCLVMEVDAYKVETEFIKPLFYCHKCKPAYTKQLSRLSFMGPVYRFYKELEVTEDGEPVWYKKIK